MLDLHNQFKDIKSFEITFSDKDNQPQRLIGSVKSIESTNIIIDVNKKQNKNIVANVGDELKLYLYTDNGIYSAISMILQANDGIINSEYVIAYPANSQHYQRREYFRADMAVDVKLAILNDDMQSQDYIIDAKTKNLCGRGMSYVSELPFLDYDAIGVSLLFKEKTIDTFAERVYSKEILTHYNTRFVHAFSFTTISQKDIDFIVKKCFLHQLELRKKYSI